MATGGLKTDIINGAYSRMRISGLTKSPSPAELTLALNRLEQMAAAFFHKSICVGYNFEETPDLNSEHGIEDGFIDGFEFNLADRLLDDFAKEATPNFTRRLRGATQGLVSNSAPRRETQYPFRMPRGKSQRARLGYNSNFYVPESRPPSGCSTNYLKVDEINDYIEPFGDYLRSPEVINSFTIEAETGLTILSSSNDDTIVSYRVRSDSNSQTGQYRSIIITITTDDNRIEKRIINFNSVALEID